MHLHGLMSTLSSITHLVFYTTKKLINLLFKHGENHENNVLMILMIIFLIYTKKKSVSLLKQLDWTNKCSVFKGI